MQFLSLWTFGFIAFATIFFFPLAYLGGRQVRRFWAWSNGTEPPKEKVIVFLVIHLLIGLIASGFVQSLFDAGSACKQSAQPLLPCTITVLGQPRD